MSYEEHQQKGGKMGDFEYFFLLSTLRLTKQPTLFSCLWDSQSGKRIRLTQRTCSEELLPTIQHSQENKIKELSLRMYYNDVTSVVFSHLNFIYLMNGEKKHYNKRHIAL